MATGTGKTFLTVAQDYRLLESKLARRILFLVDQKALAALAAREFISFTTPKGNKLFQEYEIFNQRLQKKDFGITSTPSRSASPQHPPRTRPRYSARLCSATPSNWLKRVRPRG